MLRIDSCLIVKNEKDNMQKLVNQLFKFSDEVHITDTGSTDGTLEMLQEMQKKHKNLFIHHFDWVQDFSAARNYSLYCYKDTDKSDFKFWCDADDLLTDKFINRLNEFKKFKIEETFDSYLVDYLYAKSIMFFQKRLSLIKTSSHLIWYDPIHEFLGSEEGKTHNTNIDFFVKEQAGYIEHQRKHVHTDRNLNIFMNMLKTNRELSSRNLYYFGSELENSGYGVLAIPIFANCVYSDDDSNMVDRLNAGLALNRLLSNQNYSKYYGNRYNAKEILNYLYDKQFIRADLLATLGNLYFGEGKKMIAEQFYKSAYEIIECNPVLSFMYDKKNTEITILLQLSVIEYYEKKNYEKSYEYNKKLYELYPDCAQAKKNMDIIEKILNPQLSEESTETEK